MATVPAFHSISPDDALVYHDQDSCSEGRLIPPQNVAAGAIGPRCDACARLDAHLSPPVEVRIERRFVGRPVFAGAFAG